MPITSTVRSAFVVGARPRAGPAPRRDRFEAAAGATVRSVVFRGSNVEIVFSDGQVLALNVADLPVGDGASVPWQYFPGLTKWLALLYKLHLDQTYPYAFQLHDFLYSGEGIAEFGLTRAQADYILFLSLVEYDPVTAEVVYRAVRLGGNPHFRIDQSTPPMWMRDP